MRTAPPSGFLAGAWNCERISPFRADDETRICGIGIPAGPFASIESSNPFRADHMDQRRRMYKTLGCLAGAMTGTASLLAWIDPSPSIPTAALTHEELLSTARSLVFDSVAIQPAQWRTVEVVDGPSMRSQGVALAAGADLKESHFYIDDEGRPSRSSRWDRQVAPSNAPHTIRIEIATDDTEPSPSPAQQHSVQALLDALNDAVSARRPL